MKDSMGMDARWGARTLVTVTLLLGGAWLVQPAEAEACGGMIYPDHAERQGGMDSQEVFLAFGSDRTTLVVSADYIDADGDTAFLLPLRSAPDEVQDADPALWVALENQTVPVVNIEAIEQTVGMACDCGPDDRGDLAGGEGGLGNSDVQVHGRGATATYQYVIVGGDTGSTITDWLGDNGFSVPAEYATAIDDYAAQDWVFLAAVVKEDAPTGSLAPLELRLPASPAEMLSIPFAFSSHSLPPSAELGITLYVAGEGAIEPANQDVALIDASEVRATSSTSSNYAELFGDRASQGAWVQEFGGAWSTSALRDWYDGYEEYGLGPDPETEADPEWLSGFGNRIALSSGRLSRFRTRLAPGQLVDLALTNGDSTDVERAFYVEYDGSERSAMDPSGLANLVFFAPILMIRRRRRR